MLVVENRVVVQSTKPVSPVSEGLEWCSSSLPTGADLVEKWVGESPLRCVFEEEVFVEAQVTNYYNDKSDAV